MRRYIKTEGIILSVKPYLESDSILRILSPDLGLLPAIARGARRTTSKRAGVLQPFNKAFFELYEGRSMYTVVQTKIIEPYANIAVDYEKAIALIFACEVVARTHEERQKISNAFELLESLLKAVGRCSKESSFVYISGFLLSYLRLLGYRLPVSKCRRCGKSFEESVFHTLNLEGSFLCEECSEVRTFGKALLAALKASSLLERKAGIQLSYGFKLDGIDSNPVKKADLTGLLKFLDTYLKDHTGVETLSFKALIETIERNV
jgi:DNA repair protein RecO (recombination protein O)